MQNTKNTILVLVILGLFVASGVVIYRGFFASAEIPSVSVGAGATPAKNIMPYGATLDFAKVEQRATTTDTYRYEVLDPATVGVPVQNLVTSPSANPAPNRR